MEKTKARSSQLRRAQDQRYQVPRNHHRRWTSISTVPQTPAFSISTCTISISSPRRQTLSSSGIQTRERLLGQGLGVRSVPGPEARLLHVDAGRPTVLTSPRSTLSSNAAASRPARYRRSRSGTSSSGSSPRAVGRRDGYSHGRLAGNSGSTAEPLES